MNKLHNALKTLNLTLEQRNELVKVLGELGGGGECLKLELSIIDDYSGVSVTLHLNEYKFDVPVSSPNKFDNINTTNDVLKNILKINNLNNIFKYNKIELKGNLNEFKQICLFNIYCVLEYDVPLNGTIFDIVYINYIFENGMINIITLYFNNNTNEAKIELKLQ